MGKCEGGGMNSSTFHTVNKRKVTELSTKTLNLRPESMKSLEENVRKTLRNIGIENLL